MRSRGYLFGAEHDTLARLLEIVEKRFLFGRSDTSRLVPDQSGPDWIKHLPEGYLRSAAQDLLSAACASPPDPICRSGLAGVLAVVEGGEPMTPFGVR
jgi:hypothetical protein